MNGLHWEEYNRPVRLVCVRCRGLILVGHSAPELANHFDLVIRKPIYQAECIESCLFVACISCKGIYGLFTQDITVDNYDEAIIAVSGAARGAAVNEQEQTTDNLAIVTAIFERSAALITNNTIIREAVSSSLLCLRDSSMYVAVILVPTSLLHRQSRNWSAHWRACNSGTRMYCKQTPQSERERAARQTCNNVGKHNLTSRSPY